MVSAETRRPKDPASTGAGEIRWHRVAQRDEMTADRPFGCSIEGLDLVVVPGTPPALHAYEARCPHQGTLLSEGELQGRDLVCRAHAWRFECESGQRRGGGKEACLKSVPCELRGRDVWIGLRPKERGGSISRRSSKPSRTFSDLPGPRGWPLVGNFFQVDVNHLHEALEAWARQYGPFYRFKLAERRVVVVADPDLNETILRARPGSYRRMGNIEPVLAEMGSAGVFSAEGDAWRRQRRLAMEALSTRHLRGFYPTLLRVLDRLRKRWMGAAEEGRTIGIQDDLMRFTVDVTTSLAFGTDMNTLERNDDIIQRHLSHIFPVLSRRLFAIFPYWRYFKLPVDRRLDRALLEIRRTLEGLVGDARRRLDALPAEEQKPSNFLEAMILARDEDGQPFADEIIFGNTLTMLLAGEDTTAHSLGWLVHLICERPDVVTRCRAEIDSVLGTDAAPRDLAIANQLPYVEAVAQEAMRLKPVAPFLALEANEDTMIGDVTITRGTQVYTLLRFPCLDAENFTAPDRFSPERWLDERPQADAHVGGTHLPFGSGPRICVGRTLALLEIRIVTAMLLKSFEIERVGAAHEVSEHFAFTMMPKNLHVRLRLRSTGAPSSEGASA